MPNHKYFANGCGDFVLDKTVCNNKICLIHCDYLQPEYSSKKNNEQYYEFSKIACCSDSVKNRFLQVSGFDENKVFTLRNFYDLTITTKTNESALEYDKQFINLVTIARLSKEKGVDRAINALYESGRQDIRYYVIGDGPQKTELLNKIKEYNLCEQVFMMGEKQNPYGFMVDADYIFVPSIHEAAPMVFDEAKVLGVPIIATETTSAREMLEEEDKIVQNSPEGLLATFAFLEKRNKGIIREINNDLQRSQFKIVLEEKENDKRICK